MRFAKQEVSMLSGLERQQSALGRQRSVAWAWIKARGVMNGQPAASHAKLTTSVLLSNHDDAEHTASWRDSLAAVNCRELARQICEQFYDLSIFNAWRGRMVQPVATSRMLSPALPSYCRQAAPVPSVESPPQQRTGKARILASVLSETPRKGAVLIPLRSKAA
jgi:hypothetical protein